MDARERRAREREAAKERFLRGLRQDLVLAGDPPSLVNQLSDRALLARRQRLFERLMTTTPGQERGCRD